MKLSLLLPLILVGCLPAIKAPPENYVYIAPLPTIAEVVPPPPVPEPPKDVYTKPLRDDVDLYAKVFKERLLALDEKIKKALENYAEDDLSQLDKLAQEKAYLRALLEKDFKAILPPAVCYPSNEPHTSEYCGRTLDFIQP